MKIYNEDFYELFNEMADLLSLLDENRFKIIAYQQAARRLKSDFEPITKKRASKEFFRKMPGIGEAIAEKMMEYIKTGKIKALENLRKQIPKPVRDLLKIPHLGPKRVKQLYLNLGIQSTPDLIQKAQSGDIANLPGFGPKLVSQILEALEKGQEKKKRHDRKAIEPLVKKLTGLLKKTKGVEKVEVGGSYRRKAPTVGDIDILIQGEKSATAVEKNILKTFKDITILGKGETKFSFVIFPDNLQVDIRFVPEDSWGAALLYFTGSKEYNVMMRKVAIDKGYLLNEYGLFDNGEYIAGKTENEVYKKLDLPPKDPKDRKG